MCIINQGRESDPVRAWRPAPLRMRELVPTGCLQTQTFRPLVKGFCRGLPRFVLFPPLSQIYLIARSFS